MCQHWQIKIVYSSFQVTIVINYVIAIATLCDWVKNRAPVSQPMRCKAKTNLTLYARFFSRALVKLHVIVRILIGSSSCLLLS